jgi:glycine cleavage system H lipoate-binding protein
MLPEIDGFKFLELLNQKGINIPVIMTTGYSTMENAVKSLHKGAIDFIPKPFTADELCSAINRGLKYIEIKDSEKDKSKEDISFVPCPPKYYRLGYSTWICKDKSGAVLLGTTDLFLKTIQSVKSIELLNAEEEVVQGSYCATLISDDAIHHPVLAPLSGRIIDYNSQIPVQPSLLEKDPYFDGWLYRIIPSDFEYEMKNLVSCRMEL